MIRVPKTINQIYEEIKDFDLVLTSDIFLASALNKIIKTSQIGKLVYTPSELSAKYILKTFNSKILTKSEIVLNLSKKLNLNMKKVHNTILKIEKIQKYTENVKQYLNEEDLEIYFEYENLPSKNNSLLRFKKEYLPSNVAIIEPDFFNILEQKTFPEKFKKINLLTKKPKLFKNFHLFSSQQHLVDKMIDLINEDNASDIAIILNTKDLIVDTIKSKLYDKKIQLKIKDYLHENLNVRTFLDFISTSLNLNEATVKELMPFLELFKININYKYNNFILSKYVNNVSKNKRLKEIFNFLELILDKTYAETLSLFKEVIMPKQLKEVLYKLNLYNEKITQNNFFNLIYYINNFQIELNNSKKGVLLLDSKSTIYIDRPVCIYLNPNNSWTKQVKKEEYINHNKEERNNIKIFQILLNQGESRLYFAQLIKDNQNNIPCFHFTQLFQREINSFYDEIFNGIKHDEINLKSKSKRLIKLDNLFKLDFFSQSSLNNFFTCPKKFEFSRIAPNEEKTYFLKGTLLHEYAEFYVNYKEFCLEKGDEFFADLLIEEYMNLAEHINKKLEKTIFLVGIKMIRYYINSLKLQKQHNLPNIISPWKKNFISKKLNKSINNINSELNFSNHSIKLKGFIDLVIDSTRIVDYKSSKKMKTTSQIIKKSILKLIKDEADFQPLVYLLELSKYSNNKKLFFYYYFFLQNFGDVIKGENSFSSNIVKITYYPMSFNEFITSKEALEIICGKGKRKDIVKLFSFEHILEVLKNNPIKNPFELNKKIPAYQRLEIEAMAIKNTKKNIDIIEDFFKEIYRLRTGKSKTYKIALFFKEDLEEFEEFISKEFNLVKKYSKQGFPRTPLLKENCKQCEFNDMCLGRNYDGI